MSHTRSVQFVIAGLVLLVGAQNALGEPDRSFAAAEARALREATETPLTERPWLRLQSNGDVAFHLGHPLKLGEMSEFRDPDAGATREGEEHESYDALMPYRDPREHVVRGLVYVTLVSRSVEYRQIERLDGLHEALRASIDIARRNLARMHEWIRTDAQPESALGEAARFAEMRARGLILDAVWNWARKSGTVLRYVTGDDPSWDPQERATDSFSVATDEKLTLRRLQEIADSQTSEIEIAMDGTSVSFDFGDFPPRALDFRESAIVTPLVRAQATVNAVSNHVREKVQAGREGVALFWQETLDQCQGRIDRGIRELADAPHGREAMRMRLFRLQLSVQDRLFTRLWSWAVGQRVPMWPVSAAWGGRNPFSIRGSGPVQVMVRPQTTRFVPTPSMYETVEEERVVAPPRVVWKYAPSTGWTEVREEAKSGVVRRQVCVTPASARQEIIPAEFLTVSVKPLYGRIVHVWFLDRWTWKTKPENRPPAPDTWDGPPARPGMNSDWVDLLSGAEEVMRRRQHRIPGYVVVVGTKCASGPMLVDLMSPHLLRIFEKCEREK